MSTRLHVRVDRQVGEAAVISAWRSGRPEARAKVSELTLEICAAASDVTSRLGGKLIDNTACVRNLREASVRALRALLESEVSEVGDHPLGTPGGQLLTHLLVDICLRERTDDDVVFIEVHESREGFEPAAIPWQYLPELLTPLLPPSADRPPIVVIRLPTGASAGRAPHRAKTLNLQALTLATDGAFAPHLRGALDSLMNPTTADLTAQRARLRTCLRGAPIDLHFPSDAVNVVLVACHARAHADGVIELHIGSEWVRAEDWARRLGWHERGPDVLVMLMCHSGRGGRDAVASVCRLGVPFVIAPAWAVDVQSWCHLTTTLVRRLAAGESLHVALATARDEALNDRSSLDARGAVVLAASNPRVASHTEPLCVLPRRTPNPRRPCDGDAEEIYDRPESVAALRGLVHAVREPRNEPTVLAALATSGSGLTTLLLHILRSHVEDGDLRFTAIDPRSARAREPDLSTEGLVLISPDLAEIALDDGVPPRRIVEDDAAAVATVVRLWLGAPRDRSHPLLLVIDWGDRPVETLREALPGVVVEDRWFRALEALDWQPPLPRNSTIPARLVNGGVHLKQQLESSHAPLAVLDAVLEARLQTAGPRSPHEHPHPLRDREIPRLVVRYAQRRPLTEAHFRVMATIAAQARNVLKKGAQDLRERGHASGARLPDNEPQLAQLADDLCSWRLLCRRPREGPGPENYALIHPVLAWSWNELNRRMTRYGHHLGEPWAGRVRTAAPALCLRDARLRTGEANALTGGLQVTLSPRESRPDDDSGDLRARAMLSRISAELCAHAFAGAHPSLYRLRVVERSDALLLFTDPDPHPLPARTHEPLELARAYLVARCAGEVGRDWVLAEARQKGAATGFLTPTGAVDVIGDRWETSRPLVVDDAEAACAVLLDAVPAVVRADGDDAPGEPSIEVRLALADAGHAPAAALECLVDLAREFVPLLLRVGVPPNGSAAPPGNLEPARRLSVEGAGDAIRVLLTLPDGGWPSPPTPEIRKWASCVCIAANHRRSPVVVHIRTRERTRGLRVADPQLADRRWLFVTGTAAPEAPGGEVIDLAAARVNDAQARRQFAKKAALRGAGQERPLSIRLGADTLPWLDAPGASLLDPAYGPALQAPLARTQRVGLGQSTVEPMWTASMLGVFLALRGWMEAPVYLALVLPGVLLIASIFSYVLLRAFAVYVGIAYLAEHPEALRTEFRWAVLSARIPLRESARRVGRGLRGQSNAWGPRARALWSRRREITEAMRDCAPELGMARFLWGVLLAGVAMARRDDPPVVFRPGLKFLGASMAITGWLVYIGTTAIITSVAGLPLRGIAMSVAAVTILALFPALAFTMRIYTADVTVLDPRASAGRPAGRALAATATDAEAEAHADRGVRWMERRETLFRAWYNVAVWISLLVAGYSAYAVAFRGANWALGLLGMLVLGLGLAAWMLSRQPRAYMRGAAAALLARVHDPTASRQDAWRQWADPPVADLTTQVLREATVRAALLGAATAVLDELNAPARARDGSAPRPPPVDISVSERWRAAYFVADPWGTIHQVSGQGASEVPPRAASAVDLYDDARVARLAGALLREVPDDTWIELPAFGKATTAGNRRAFRLLVRKLALFDQSPLRGTLGIAVPIGEPCEAAPGG